MNVPALVERAGRSVVSNGAAAAEFVFSLGWSVRRRLEAPGTVALTFDDGPNPDFTPALLALLDDLQVQATFFLVGRRVEEAPELARRIALAGHVIGSHSHSHPDPWTVPLRRLAEDYRRGREVVEKVVGREVRLFRPPKGYIDAKGVVAMRVAGLQPFLWSVDSHDWEPDTNPTRIEDRLQGVRAGDVVLLHDSIEAPIEPSALDRRSTLAALPTVISEIRAIGLNFSGLPHSVA